MDLSRKILVYISLINICLCLELDLSSLELDNIGIKDGDSFDYIVVGGGTTGSVVAKRLADLKAKVLVIEVGTNPSIFTDAPGFAPSLLGSEEDWKFETASNNVSCKALLGDNCKARRGKVMGGSSSINFMMYVRGNSDDFNRWNRTGWRWNEFRPYFLKYERNMGLDKLPKSSITYHNTNGTLKVDLFPDSGNSYHAEITEGWEALNFPFNADINAESQIGVTHVTGYAYKGERSSASTAYLEVAVKSEYLTLLKKSRATKVLIDKNNNAIGVDVNVFLRGNMKFYCNKEVIVSAGAILSPQLLMLSGIGPRKHLESLGIDVIADLPVGVNVTDHAGFLGIVEGRRGYGLNVPVLLPIVDTSINSLQWLSTKTGPMASNGLTDVAAFFNTDCYNYDTKSLENNKPECELPNVQVIFSYVDAGLITLLPNITQQSSALKDEYIDQLREMNANKALVIITPILLKPKSQGRILLNSTDPLDQPYIYPNYLGESEDVEVLLKVWKVVLDLIATGPLEHTSLARFKIEECDRFDYATNNYWRCHIRYLTTSIFHSVGSTALGRVVNEELKVYNVGNLRVADAGIMPELPRGNTAASCYAIGEKLADLLKDLYHSTK